MIPDSIKGCQLFQGVDKENINRLLESSRIVDFEIGQTILRHGLVENFVYVIAEGSARLLVENEKKELTTIGTGAKFDALGVIDVLRQTSTECATARVNSKMIAIEASKLIELCQDSKEFRDNINNYTNLSEEIELEKW